MPRPSPPDDVTLPAPSPAVPATPPPTGTTAAAPAAPPSGEPLSWRRTDRSLTDPWLAEALRHMPPDSPHHDAGSPPWPARLREAVLAAADQALAADAAEAARATVGGAHHALTAGAVGDVGTTTATTPAGAVDAVAAAGDTSPKRPQGSAPTAADGQSRPRRRFGWGLWIGLCGALMAAAGLLWLRQGPWR